VSRGEKHQKNLFAVWHWAQAIAALEETMNFADRAATALSLGLQLPVLASPGLGAVSQQTQRRPTT
jgi:hypothetical protein